MTMTLALTALTLLALTASPASAQSGAKALFYGSSGAQLQTNAPAPGPMMSRPETPGSNMATGFPTAPAMPGMPAPAPTMPAMTPPPPPPAMPSSTTTGMPAMPPSTATGAPAMMPPPMPGEAPSSPAAAAEDLNKIVDQLKAAADTLPAGSPAVADAGTKDVTVVGAAPAMGVKYWVELVDQNGTQRQVTTEYVFRAGDRIRLHMSSNRDGYLTLVNLGSSGRTTVLFPSGGANNFVKAGTDYAVPPGGYLRFDENKGQETLILTFSPQAGTPSASAAMAMARGGAKDLLMEVDASSPQPATYAVAPPRPGNQPATVAIQIKLNHQ